MLPLILLSLLLQMSDAGLESLIEHPGSFHNILDLFVKKHYILLVNIEPGLLPLLHQRYVDRIRLNYLLRVWNIK